jgi:hypothetical protein
MKTKIKLSLLIASILSINFSVQAKQCISSEYNYRLGHQAINKNLTLPKSKAKMISVCLDDTLPPDWRNAVSTGIVKLRSELSTINTFLDFIGGYIVDPSNQDDLDYRGCDVSITYQHGLGTEKMALTEGSSIASDFSRIAINAHLDEDLKNTGDQLSKNGMEYVIAHELLHTVGLMHTGDLNIEAKAYIDIKEIPDTDGFWQTRSVAPSLMCVDFDKDNIPTTFLNSIDRQAIEYLYPK